jgi:NADH:ubiquinone oxidoreductase subunit K
MTLYHVLTLSAILFSIGVYGVLARKSLIAILMSIELMFNAANLNLVAFNHFLYPDSLWGHGLILLIITVAAAEAVVGLALVIAIYRNTQNLTADTMHLLHD